MNVKGVRRLSELLNLHTAVSLLGLAAAAGVVIWLGNALMTGGERVALSALAIAFALLMIVMRPSWGLILWVALAPFTTLFNVDLGRGIPNISLNRVAPLVLAFVVLAEAATGRRRLARPILLDGLIVLFVLGLLPGVVNSPAPLMIGLRTVFDWVVVPLLVYWFARNLLTDPPTRKAMLIAVVTVGAVLGVIAALDQFANLAILAPANASRAAYGAYAHKVTSVFGSSAIMSMALGLSVPVALLLIVWSETWPGRLAALLALLSTLFGDLIVYVRGGWLAAVVGVVTLVALSRRVRKGLLPALVISALILLALGGLLINQEAITSRLGAEGSITYRADAWRVGLKVVQRSPVFGLGFFTFEQETLNAGWTPRNGRGTVAPIAAPHNMFLYVLTSAGLAGLVPILLVLGAVFWQGVAAWRQARRTPGADEALPALLIAVLLAYVAMANTFDALAATYGNIIFFALAGMTFAAPSMRREAETA